MDGLQQKATISAPHIANRLCLFSYTVLFRSIWMLIQFRYNLMVISSLGQDIYIPE